jgi:hypothetical protein
MHCCRGMYAETSPRGMAVQPFPTSILSHVPMGICVTLVARATCINQGLVVQPTGNRHGHKLMQLHDLYLVQSAASSCMRGKVCFSAFHPTQDQGKWRPWGSDIAKRPWVTKIIITYSFLLGSRRYLAGRVADVEAHAARPSVRKKRAI